MVRVHVARDHTTVRSHDERGGDRVRSLGGEIVLIGPETEENALKLTDKTQATIPLLHDTNGAVAEG